MIAASSNGNLEERRERFRRTDLYFKSILILFGIIQGGIGWGLKEIYTTLRQHDTKITVVETTLSKEQAERSDFRNNITSRLDRIDDKLDRILETGVLNNRRP